jgi:hypothetical protein
MARRLDGWVQVGSAGGNVSGPPLPARDLRHSGWNHHYASDIVAAAAGAAEPGRTRRPRHGGTRTVPRTDSDITESELAHAQAALATCNTLASRFKLKMMMR